MPDLDALLHAAVTDLGGSERAGQQQMAHAVADVIDSSEHLLVQAGTGTGKSLAYLVPAIAHALNSGRPVVVADPDSPAATALRGVARQLARRGRGLAGRKLGITPTLQR